MFLAKALKVSEEDPPMVDDKPAPKPNQSVESFDASPAEDGEEPHLPLHNEVYASAETPVAPGNQGAQTEVTQVAQAAPVEKTEQGDRVAQGGANAGEPLDPYEQVAKTQALVAQIEQLSQGGTTPDATQIEQLKRQVVVELELAKKAADAIRMKGDATNPGIDDLAKANRQQREMLMKDLGLDSSKEYTIDDLGREYQRANGNVDRQNKIKDLANAIADRDILSRLHYAPLTVRAVEAELRARGMLDPTLKVGQEVPDAQFKLAFETLKGIPLPGSQADIDAFGANSKEVREAQEVIAGSEKTVSIHYMAQQQERGGKIIEEVAKAKRGEGNVEEHYKTAIRMADTLNEGWLADQVGLEQNKTLGVSQELVDVLRMGSNARLKYAEFLVSNGRFHEAQGLMAKVKSVSPELIYDKQGDQVVYREHEGGHTYESLDRAVSLGVTANPGNFDAAQSMLFDKLGSDKIGTAGDANKFLDRIRSGELKSDADIMKHLRENGTSTEALKMMKLCREQYRKDITEANRVLDKEVEALDVRKREFDQKQTLTKEEEIEKKLVERQIDSLKQTRQNRDAYINRIDALTDFTEGIVHLSQGGAKSAHELFESALKKDPSLDEDLKKMKGGSNDLKTLSELSAMTDSTLDAYWQRNYKKFAIAGAATVGTLTGVGLIGLGGYVGAGITTTAVVATVGGAGLGGLTSLGIHRTVDPNAGWAEFRDGAKVGGLSAALVASPWAAQAYRAKMGADVVVSTSAIGNLASKIGVTKGLLGGSMAMSYSLEAGNVLIDGKPVTRALTDGTKDGVFNSLLLGISRNWGLPGEAAAANKNFFSGIFTRYTTGTGLTLAAIPEIAAVGLDGKPIDKALKEGGTNALQYTIFFGIANKARPTEVGSTSGLASLGLKPWTYLGGTALAGAPELKNWYLHNKPGEEALRDWGVNSVLNTAGFAFLQKYGMSDYGTKGISNPTMRNTWGYAGRAFAMQESWNVAMSLGTKQLVHDLGRDSFYISRDGQGFIAPLVADYLDYNYGKGLDPTHLGDRKTINQRLDQLNTPLTSSLFIEKKSVDPQTQGPKTGLFFDYSKPPEKRDK